MHSSEIRSRFLAFFERNGHRVLPSASLVPAGDPTLLFVNAGMVPFKKMFLGQEEPVPGRRATTSQKCVRAGGKHNDLEQVGHTARHHTFFEMLGNFSFGDYFKRDAIAFAWEFLTGPVDRGGLGLDPRHLRVTVFREDQEARTLWRELAGLSDDRVYGLGEKDNFWQMADTGPCGPCSEIYVDLARVTGDWTPPAGSAGAWTEIGRDEFALKDFVDGVEAGRFLEVWNLVFMQFDRQPDGTLVPLPKPSVDTGMGLERIAAVIQGKASNFHTDLFEPLLERAAEVTGAKHDGEQAAHRVIADHARAVAFLLADGVFPSNEGRGYVLRRILRRAVRHAWLLGRAEPTLAPVVDTVIGLMSGSYPELRQRAKHIVETTRAEEERFLTTIEGGMKRFDDLAPPATTQGSKAMKGTISGEDAFRLYDTFGFPLDLTELMARERGYTVDVEGFERCLEAQRTQSKEERRAKKVAVSADDLAAGDWRSLPGEVDADLRFVGYDSIEARTRVVAARTDLGGGRAAVVLQETPFYAESGGQISDTGEIVGEGWRMEVEEVRRLDGRVAAVGRLHGELSFGDVIARVPRDRRLDTERNHTATHLLHAALREVLGEHVHQAGSLVAPDRLRFDFTHHGPVAPEQLAEVEDRVNRAIFAALPVGYELRPYAEAVAGGAMALFGEKYGDVVRVVSVPGISKELCGGTHVRNTSEIGLFRITSERGVAAGVRRIEALTGPGALLYLKARDVELARVEKAVGGAPSEVASKVEEMARAGKSARQSSDAGQLSVVRELVERSGGAGERRVIASRVEAPDVKALQLMGDALRSEMGSGVGVLAASFDGEKSTVLVVVTDDLREKGVRADELIRGVAALAGGKGGGKPHMAQAGIPDSSRIDELLAAAPKVVDEYLRSRDGR